MSRPARTLLRTLSLVLLTALCVSFAHPVAAQTPVRIPIAARALARGAVLTVNDIVYRDSVVRTPTDTNHVSPGWVTRRMVAAGEVLHAPAVSPPIILQANQSVDIEWADRNVSLKVHGTATRAASMGERVTVRTDAGRRIDAVVVGPGLVRLD